MTSRASSNASVKRLRRTRLRTRATSSSPSNGLPRKSVTPAEIASSLSLRVAPPVIMTTGTKRVRASPRRRGTTSWPVRPDRCRSSRMTSGTAGGQAVDGLVGGGGVVHLETLVGQQVAQEVAHLLVVVDDEDAPGAGAGAAVGGGLELALRLGFHSVVPPGFVPSYAAPAGRRRQPGAFFRCAPGPR